MCTYQIRSYQTVPNSANLLYVLIDSIIAGLTVRFNAAKVISSRFRFLWKYLEMSQNEMKECAKALATTYSADIGPDIVDEMCHLPSVHRGNFVEKSSLHPLALLNRITEYRLNSIFPNVCVALRIFLTIPATVASAERSFSKLKLINNYLRTTMIQDRLVGLAMLSIEHNIARTISFDTVISNFASRKSRRVLLD